jgi:hypothetical protein
LPRFTKNKIDDSRIEGTVKDLTENHHPRVKELATTVKLLLDVINNSFLKNGAFLK